MFQTVAALITVWKVFLWIGVTLFFSRLFPDECLKYFPRYSRAQFNNRFRKKLGVVMENKDLVAMPRGWQDQMSLRHQLKKQITNRMGSNMRTDD